MKNFNFFDFCLVGIVCLLALAAGSAMSNEEPLSAISSLDSTRLSQTTATTPAQIITRAAHNSGNNTNGEYSLKAENLCPSPATPLTKEMMSYCTKCHPILTAKATNLRQMMLLRE